MIPNSPTAAAGRYPGLPLPELRRAAKNGFHPQGAALGFPVAALDAGADTISSVEYVNGQLWGTLSSSMKDGSGNKIKVVDYFAFTPQITNGKLSASLFTQRVIAQRGLFLMYPAIALNTDGNGAIVFSFSGRTTIRPLRLSASRALP